MHTKKINIKNQVHYHYENSIKPKKLETRNFFFKKDLVIYFSRNHPDKLQTMLDLYYEELIGKIEEYEGIKYVIVDDYTLDKVLDKIKRIDIEKLDHPKS